MQNTIVQHHASAFSKLKRKLKGKGGFTLVELIVVLVIMGILTAAILPTVTGYVAEAREKVDESNAYMVEQAARLYLADYEVNGGTELPQGLTASALVAAGYLSELPEGTEYNITYEEKAGGRYDVKAKKPEKTDESTDASETA